jgi:uncharacterized damage-inducible protein DinB
VTLTELRQLVDYHYWGRDRLLDAVEAITVEQFTRDLGSSFRSIRDTLAHLYFAEWAWYSRWTGNSPTAWPDPARFGDVPSLRQAWAETEPNVRVFLERMGEDGIGRVIEYKFLNGQSGATPFWQTLQHLVNHGSYHRGQVTTMLRQLGGPPPKSMDLISFYRERA